MQLSVFPAGLAIVLAWSACAKLVRPASHDPRLSASLGVPGWVLRLHPYLELTVALLLVAVPSPWLAAPAFGAVMLGAGYVWLSIRGARKGVEDCGCFGSGGPAAAPVPDIARAGLVLVSAAGCLAATVAHASVPAAVAVGEGGWLAMACLGVVATGLPGALRALFPPRPRSVVKEEAGVFGPNDEFLGADWDGRAVPALVLQRIEAGGGLVNAAALASHRPALLVFVSHDCQYCELTVARFASDLSWAGRHDLVLVGSKATLDALEVPLAQRLVDPFGAGKERMGSRVSPAAYLFGVDGRINGPAFGPAGIHELSMSAGAS